MCALKPAVYGGDRSGMVRTESEAVQQLRREQHRYGIHAPAYYQKAQRRRGETREQDG